MAELLELLLDEELVVLVLVPGSSTRVVPPHAAAPMPSSKTSCWAEVESMVTERRMHKNDLARSLVRFDQCGELGHVVLVAAVLGTPDFVDALL